MKKNKNILKITKIALDRVKSLIETSNSNVLGLRIGIKTAGCSGMKYTIEYAENIKKFEEKIEIGGINLFIDPSAVMFLIGSTMDYKESKFNSGFEFINPNEVSRCGCGESFSVKNM